MTAQIDDQNIQSLKARFLDGYRHTIDRKMLDTVAHMIIEIDRSDHLINVALSFLSDQLNAGRVDIGFSSSKCPSYEIENDYIYQGAISTVGKSLPNKNRAVQKVWNSPFPVIFEDVKNDYMIGELKETFLSVSSQSMIAQRLNSDQGSFGIVCMDDLDGARQWTSSEQTLVLQFCNEFFSPLLKISQQIEDKKQIDKPSPAELEAIRLASAGLKYKQIAAQLDKSIRTIEVQLRNARAKTGAANQTELVRVCQHWL